MPPRKILARGLYGKGFSFDGAVSPVVVGGWFGSNEAGPTRPSVLANLIPDRLDKEASQRPRLCLIRSGELLRCKNHPLQIRQTLCNADACLRSVFRILTTLMIWGIKSPDADDD